MSTLDMWIWIWFLFLQITVKYCDDEHLCAMRVICVYAGCVLCLGPEYRLDLSLIESITHPTHLWQRHFQPVSVRMKHTKVKWNYTTIILSFLSKPRIRILCKTCRTLWWYILHCRAYWGAETLQWYASQVKKRYRHQDPPSFVAGYLSQLGCISLGRVDMAAPWLPLHTATLSLSIWRRDL